MNRLTRLGACIPLTVMVVALGVLPAFGQRGDEAAINRRVEELYEAIAKGDVRAYVAAWHQDAVRAIGTAIAVGRPAIENAVTAQFAQGGPIKFTRHDTRLLSPTTAIVHGEAGSGHAIFTLVKEGDNWLIAALQTTAPAP